MPNQQGVLLTEQLASGAQPPGDLALSRAWGSRTQMSPWGWGLGFEGWIYKEVRTGGLLAARGVA